MIDTRKTARPLDTAGNSQNQWTEAGRTGAGAHQEKKGDRKKGGREKKGHPMEREKKNWQAEQKRTRVEWQNHL